MDEKTRYALETVLYGKKEAKRRRRIRKRFSYSYWKEFLTKDLKDLPFQRKAIVAWNVFNFIDSHKGFGYATNAHFSAESLALALEDLRNESENRE